MGWLQKLTRLLRREVASLAVSRNGNARIRTINVPIRMNRAGLAIKKIEGKAMIRN